MVSKSTKKKDYKVKKSLESYNYASEGRVIYASSQSKADEELKRIKNMIKK